MNNYETDTNHQVQEGLKKVDTTKYIEIRSGAIERIGTVFKNLFNGLPAIIIADNNTYPAAGKNTKKALENYDIQIQKPYIFKDPDLFAHIKFVDELTTILSTSNVIPIAVGSGTINDLVKLAAHRCDREYMVVATAGSIDGYAAFGASITERGIKKTIPCPAPVAIIADLDIIANAPEDMNSWGYADLLAKIPAGADWIISDALGIEPIDRTAWRLVQKPLRRLVANPNGVVNRDKGVLCYLMEGLIMSGLAMQKAHTSRAGSGAEHQFSHLWDMQHHTYNGKAPSHGFKVAVGSLATMSLYETLMSQNTKNKIKCNCSSHSFWPEYSDIIEEIKNIFTNPEEADQLIEHCRAKHFDKHTVNERINIIQSIWPDLYVLLKKQLISYTEYRDLLQQANAPINPQEIGISRERLKWSFHFAQFIRNRYTILDFLANLGCLRCYISQIFESEKFWPKDLK